jgi:hypothetical protein
VTSGGTATTFECKLSFHYLVVHRELRQPGWAGSRQDTALRETALWGPPLGRGFRGLQGEPPG